MSLMTKEGFGALKFSYFVLAAGIGVAIFLVVGSYLYWQAEKVSNVQSQRRLSDAQSRLANAKQQRDDLRNSEDTYNALVTRGVFIPESRLDLLDAMEVLKARHGITSLAYELSPQRPLRLAGGTTITAVDALGTRIRVRAASLHDGDMLAFLDEFSRMQRGLFPMERCAITRNQRAAALMPPPTATATGDGEAVATPATALVSAIEADCSLEWITLVDKHTAIADAPVAATAAQPRQVR